MTQLRIRWMGYDLLCYLILSIIFALVAPVDIPANTHLLIIFSVFALWQGLKWIFCMDATKYVEWNVYRAFRKGR